MSGLPTNPRTVTAMMERKRSDKRKYGYPLDKAKQVTETVIQQAELLGEEWAG